MAFTSDPKTYNDTIAAIYDRIRPKIVEQVSKSNAFHSYYKQRLSRQKNLDEALEVPMSNETIGFANADAEPGQYTTITVSGGQGLTADPNAFVTSTQAVFTTQNTGGTTWYYPPVEQQQWGYVQVQGVQPLQVSQPAMGPIEEPPPPAVVPPVEPKRGRMIKLGKKR